MSEKKYRLTLTKRQMYIIRRSLYLASNFTTIAPLTEKEQLKAYELAQEVEAKI